MTARPPSIVRYERLYLTAVAIGLVVTAVTWQQSVAAFAATPMLARLGWLLAVLTVAGLALRLLLWWFTARVPSVVAKWVVVVFAALSAIGILTGLYALMVGQGRGVVPVLLSLLASVLHVAAAVLLFRPDARAWFGEDVFEDREEA